MKGSEKIGLLRIGHFELVGNYKCLIVTHQFLCSGHKRNLDFDGYCFVHIDFHSMEKEDRCKGNRVRNCSSDGYVGTERSY